MKMGKKWEDFFEKVWYNISVESESWPRNFFIKGALLMKRKQFTFYESFHASIQTMTSQREKLQAYETICDYALYGKLPDPEVRKPSILAVFSIIKPVLDAGRKRSSRILGRDKLSLQEKEEEEKE